MRFLLTYRSLTYAQRAARLLERAGITGTVSRVPRSVGARGCAYGVLVSPRDRARAAKRLAEAKLGPERIFALEADGSVREADDDLS